MRYLTNGNSDFLKQIYNVFQRQHICPAKDFILVTKICQREKTKSTFIRNYKIKKDKEKSKKTKNNTSQTTQ